MEVLPKLLGKDATEDVYSVRISSSVTFSSNEISDLNSFCFECTAVPLKQRYGEVSPSEISLQSISGWPVESSIFAGKFSAMVGLENCNLMEF